QIVYPQKTASDLKPGETYRLVVEAQDCVPVRVKKCSSDEEGPGRGFTVLTKDTVARVHQTEAAINSLPLAKQSRQFLIANYYAYEELYTEAISQLEEIAAGNSQPAFEQTLGNLYRQVGLSRFADKHFLRALAFAESSGDTESQALANRAL